MLDFPPPLDHILLELFTVTCPLWVALRGMTRSLLELLMLLCHDKAVIPRLKKAERQRIDAFKLWCWRRLLRVRWTARRSNQSILKEINPEYSLERLMLKLKRQYFGQLCKELTH